MTGAPSHCARMGDRECLVRRRDPLRSWRWGWSGHCSCSGKHGCASLHAKCFKTPRLLDGAKENLLHGHTRSQMLLLKSVFRAQAESCLQWGTQLLWRGLVCIGQSLWLAEDQGPQLENTSFKETSCGRDVHSSPHHTAPRDRALLHPPQDPSNGATKPLESSHGRKLTEDQPLMVRPLSQPSHGQSTHTPTVLHGLICTLTIYH